MSFANITGPEITFLTKKVWITTLRGQMRRLRPRFPAREGRFFHGGRHRAPVGRHSLQGRRSAGGKLVCEKRELSETGENRYWQKHSIMKNNGLYKRTIKGWPDWETRGKTEISAGADAGIFVNLLTLCLGNWAFRQNSFPRSGCILTFTERKSKISVRYRLCRTIDDKLERGSFWESRFERS